MRALVCGITGQDGAYLAQLLLGKGYEVWGTSRQIQPAATDHLRQLGLLHKLTWLQMNAAEGVGVHEALEQSRPDEIYWLASPSSVGQSFAQPLETVRDTVLGITHMLEALRQSWPEARLFHASSGEIYGDLGPHAADERSPIQATSPYAAAKAAAHAVVQSYRAGYGLFASNGVLFNHESPLRPPSFVTRKIVMAAARARAQGDPLSLGRLDIARDWGWAPDYVKCMWLTLQHTEADDFVIATGQTHALTDFVSQAYAFFDLDWREHVRSDASLFRPSDRAWSQGNPAKAAQQLGWVSAHHMPDVVRLMCEAERALLLNGPDQGRP